MPKLNDNEHLLKSMTSCAFSVSLYPDLTLHTLVLGSKYINERDKRMIFSNWICELSLNLPDFLILPNDPAQS